MSIRSTGGTGTARRTLAPRRQADLIPFESGTRKRDWSESTRKKGEFRDRDLRCQGGRTEQFWKGSSCAFKSQSRLPVVFQRAAQQCLSQHINNSCLHPQMCTHNYNTTHIWLGCLNWTALVILGHKEHPALSFQFLSATPFSFSRPCQHVSVHGSDGVFYSHAILSRLWPTHFVLFVQRLPIFNLHWLLSNLYTLTSSHPF